MTRLSFWYAALSGAFLLLVAWGYELFTSVGGIAVNISPFDFFVMSLATMRLVRLFTFDKVTAPVRDWLGAGAEGSLRNALFHLSGCLWCTGIWAGFLVVFLFFAYPITWYVVLALALSAAGSLLQLIASLLGSTVEIQKRRAQ
jgi:hypothetical protein